MLKVKAKIIYTIKPDHPNIGGIRGWEPNKLYDFEDTYMFDHPEYYDPEEIVGYIKKDLRLCAGGGYRADTVGNVKYEMKIVA